MGDQRFELVALEDAAAVARAVAEVVLESRLGGELSLLPIGLATGNTMEPVYLALARLLEARPAAERDLIRSTWLSFSLDEYVGLSKEHPSSFAATLSRQVALPLGLKRNQLQGPDGLSEDPGAEAHRYAEALLRAGGVGLQLLGLGLNGHVAFNEPPCSADAPCRVVALSSATRERNASAFGGDPAQVPRQAITLGLAEILAARRILLVVTGPEKRGALRRLLKEPMSPALPASWLHNHAMVQVIADHAALGGPSSSAAEI